IHSLFVSQTTVSYSHHCFNIKQTNSKKINMLLSSVSTKFLSGSATAFRRSFHASTTCLEKLNVEGLAKKVDLDGKNVLVRVDLNVPLAKVCIVSIFN
ncbi:MAG: hypothetical protein ACI90V_012570, partial [Bacillariaceae sp.]